MPDGTTPILNQKTLIPIGIGASVLVIVISTVVFAMERYHEMKAEVIANASTNVNQDRRDEELERAIRSLEEKIKRSTDALEVKLDAQAKALKEINDSLIIIRYRMGERTPGDSNAVN